MERGICVQYAQEGQNYDLLEQICSEGREMRYLMVERIYSHGRERRKRRGSATGVVGYLRQWDAKRGQQRRYGRG